MAEEKQGKEISADKFEALPRDKRGEGFDPDEPDPEAEGQQYAQVWYVNCWRCSATNKIWSHWRGFRCWNCEAYNAK